MPGKNYISRLVRSRQIVAERNDASESFLFQHFFTARKKPRFAVESGFRAIVDDESSEFERFARLAAEIIRQNRISHRVRKDRRADQTTAQKKSEPAARCREGRTVMRERNVAFRGRHVDLGDFQNARIKKTVFLNEKCFAFAISLRKVGNHYRNFINRRGGKLEFRRFRFGLNLGKKNHRKLKSTAQNSKKINKNWSKNFF